MEAERDVEIRVRVANDVMVLWYDVSDDVYHMEMGEGRGGGSILLTEANVERLIMALVQLRALARGVRRGGGRGSGGGGERDAGA